MPHTEVMILTCTRCLKFLLFCANRKAKKLSKADMRMSACFTFIMMIPAMLSVAVGDKCGYVRGPLASTNDTVVISLNCSQLTPSSGYVPLQLRDNATHVAVQLLHCHTVPVGLFTNVTDNLTSVTVASEDAVQLLEGTFEGLGHVTELRLLGFGLLKNPSRSFLEPLRNIRSLIIDGFGSANIELPYLGSIIRKLSGTPIRRLVLNKVRNHFLNNIRNHVFFQRAMKVDDFRISNASLKELIITDVPFNFEGSIRRAFPVLTCFCGGGRLYQQTAATYPAVIDLFLISDTLKEMIVYVPKDLRALPSETKFIPLKGYLPALLMTAFLYPNLTALLYPDLLNYYRNRSASEDCALGIIVKIGAHLSKLTVNGLSFTARTDKPLCFEEDNSLIYFDLTGSLVAEMRTEFIGLKRLRYLSLENTGITELSNTFLRHYPSLKVLKLSKLNIGEFMKNSDGELFGSCPTLTDVHLDDSNITNIPATMFSRSVNLQRLDMSKNHLRTFDFDLQNCTRLKILNFSRNNIENIIQKRIIHLSELASRKTGEYNFVVDLSDNRLHCLCNTTHFIKWMQSSPTDSKINFPGFDTYTCLYPNGSIVHVSEVIVSELDQQCNVIQTLVNREPVLVMKS